MNLDDYITGTYDANAPFNESETVRDYAEVISELEVDDANIIEQEMELLKMELKRLKYAYNCKRKSVEILVENIEGLESHTYVKNILKDLFL
jgi:hypothetical protein